MVSVVEYDGFYGAAKARSIAMGQASGANDILAEINALQVLVDNAAASGQLEVIADSTTMTSNTAYFTAWNDPYNNDDAADKLNRAKMNAVINYFSRLGYTIRRGRVALTDFFQWKISW